MRENEQFPILLNELASCFISDSVDSDCSLRVPSPIQSDLEEVLKYFQAESLLLNVKECLSKFNDWQLSRLKSAIDLNSAQNLAVAFTEERTHWVDCLILHWFNRFKQASTENPYFSLIAIGGYGRNRLSIHSDIDLLIVLDKNSKGSDTSTWISLLTQFLWDIGLIPSIKTLFIEELKTSIQSDLGFQTSVLFPRLLYGSVDLFNSLIEMSRPKSLIDVKQFISAKYTEQIERHKTYQDTSYHLEPDLLKTPGSLRDIHLVYWIEKQWQLVDTLGILEPPFKFDIQLLQEAESLLILLRFALHSVVSRKEDRILFMHQLTLSEAYRFYHCTKNDSSVGYIEAKDKTNNVEMLMKHFYQASARVSLQCFIFKQNLIEKIFFASNKKRKYSLFKNIEYIEYEASVINYSELDALLGTDSTIQRPSQFRRLHFKSDHFNSLEEVFTFFEAMVSLGVRFEQISAHTVLQLSLFQCSNKSIYNDRVHQQFIKLLKHPKGLHSAIIPMHQLGILWSYEGSWSHVRGLMQFDRFHAYTVDEHTIQVLLHIDSLKNHSEEDLIGQIYSTDFDLSTLVLAGFFHDLGKGKEGAHERIGKKIFDAFSKKHTLEEQEKELISWLIVNHLNFSITAQRRDLTDPYLIETFANFIQDEKRLNLLYLLTIADIKGTNSHLFTPWKKALLDELYIKTKFFLVNSKKLNRQWREDIRIKQIKARQIIYSNYEVEILTYHASKDIHLKRVNELWQRCRIDYFFFHTPEKIAWHADKLISESYQFEDCERYLVNHQVKNKNALKSIQISDFYLPSVSIFMNNQLTPGATELFIWTADKKNLFAAIVSLIDRKNLSILQAQIFTQRDSMAMDTFIIAQRDQRPLPIARQLDLKFSLMTMLSREELEVFPARRTLISMQCFATPTKIIFINHPKKKRTEVEISTLDRPGLLAIIASVFAKLSLHVLGARIMTVGEKVQDMFILTTAQRFALDEALQNVLKNELLIALEGRADAQ